LGTGKQFALLLSVPVTYSKSPQTAVCHMALKMLTHPFLGTAGLKISKVITAINRKLSLKEGRQLLTILFLSAK